MTSINMADLAIALDCLIGSLNIADGGTHWKYTKEQRHLVAEKIINAMGDCNIKIVRDNQTTDVIVPSLL